MKQLDRFVICQSDEVLNTVVDMKIQLQKKHLLLTRWNHWVNFPVLTIMVWSGFLIYWAYPAYFIPGDWLDRIGMGYQLARGMGWHFAFGILFLINGVLYVSYSILSGHWRYTVPDRNSLREAWEVLLHDVHIRRHPLPRPVKYNGAQRIFYSSVIVLAAIATLSGFAIYKPVQLNELTTLLGGYKSARLIHFLIALVFVLFFIVHIIQVIRSGWNNFRAMVTGWEKVGKEDSK
jgi:thiosulfate reductase cytochrome b subunit